MNRHGRGKVELLADKTIKECGYNPIELSLGSHKRVYVKCITCNEEFLREFRILNNLHCCPAFCVIGGVDHKWCNSCNKFLTLDGFHNNKNRKYGLDAYCRICINDGVKSRKNNLNKWIRYIVNVKKSQSKKDNTKFALDFEYLFNLWQNQGGRCYYSNVPMVFGVRKLHSASLERIDPNSGYIPNNVAWVSKATNYMKNNASYDDFVDFISKINFTKHTMLRCEFKKMVDHAILPHRSNPLDAGLDIHSTISVVLKPHEFTNINTGICISPPEGYYFTIEGRSGLSRHGLEPLRGIIDASYTGELIVTMLNISDKPYNVSIGDRVAQLIIHLLYCPDLVEVESFSLNYRERGKSGYGSTGK